ncbi:hypothetical protein LOAG_01302 [Loa loa]|uniref:Vps41 beta-propeller domain-containing protein n=1 Tax=Loa loa TaxID=7209 RepID=A0A1S0U962_LOALO|nr:hypothetical protein LOAG_01302 [Loa loa]EFO27177.1 hypothetical protein LOAG_01302 [Loa loa]
MQKEQVNTDVAQIDEEKNNKVESDIEEVLLEPRFKYSRILNNIPGTARHHRCPVTKISIDPTGSYFVSCSQDARISIGGITSFELSQIIDLKLAARSVAIDPDFTKRSSGHMFITGERNLLLHQRTFFGNYREKVVIYIVTFEADSASNIL